MSTETRMDVKSRYIQILRDNGVHDEVTRVEIVVPDLHGDHFASSCDYVTVHRENGKPNELFVKRLIDNPAYSKMLKDMKVFEKEGGFFQEILPELQRVIKSTVFPDMEYNSNFGPKCYFANEDTIVMENLVKRGYVLLDKNEFQDLETARLESKSQTRELCDMVIRTSGYFSISQIQIKKMDMDQFNSLLTKCIALIELNNMMFEQDPISKQLLGLIFVDFQMIHIGSPNLDIASYLFTSVMAEVRQKEWKTLLQFYFDSLVESVQALNGSVAFSFEDFLEDFKKKFTPGFIWGLCSGGLMEAMGDAGNLDEIQGDVMAHVNDAFVKWVENNPEKVKAKAKDVSALF